MSANQEKNQALTVLESELKTLSTLYKECYLSMGRGALLVYASSVIERRLPSKMDYRTKDEILEVFDDPTSHAELKQMINGYDQKKEGIITLITSYSNATFFVTLKFK